MKLSPRKSSKTYVVLLASYFRGLTTLISVDLILGYHGAIRLTRIPKNMPKCVF